MNKQTKQGILINSIKKGLAVGLTAAALGVVLLSGFVEWLRGRGRDRNRTGRV
jgi:hypothetical protein